MHTHIHKSTSSLTHTHTLFAWLLAKLADDIKRRCGIRRSHSRNTRALLPHTIPLPSNRSKMPCSTADATAQAFYNYRSCIT